MVKTMSRMWKMSKYIVLGGSMANRETSLGFVSSTIWECCIQEH